MESDNKFLRLFNQATLTLTLLSIFKYVFFVITFSITWVIMLVEVIIMISTLNVFKTNWTNKFNEKCLSILRWCVDKEINIILKQKK